MNNIKKNIDRVIPIKGLFKQSGYFLNKLLHDIVDKMTGISNRLNEFIDDTIANIDNLFNEIFRINDNIDDIYGQIGNIKTFTEVLESDFENTSNKSIYKDTIVFIVDNNGSKINKIWVNDKFYEWNTNIINIWDNSNDYNIVLDPNTYYKLENQIDKLTITLNQLSNTKVNKYYLEFFGNSPSVIFNNDIVFDKDIIPNFDYSLSEDGMCKFILEFNNNVCSVKYLKYVNDWYELTYNVTDYNSSVKLINHYGGSNIIFKINE